MIFGLHPRLDPEQSASAVSQVRRREGLDGGNT